MIKKNCYLWDDKDKQDGCTQYKNGTLVWHLEGRLHREDGPAIILPNGTQKWYLNGLYHRENGPAVIYASGTECWFIHGKRLDELLLDFDWKKEGF